MKFALGPQKHEGRNKGYIFSILSNEAAVAGCGNSWFFCDCRRRSAMPAALAHTRGWRGRSQPAGSSGVPSSGEEHIARLHQPTKVESPIALTVSSHSRYSWKGVRNSGASGATLAAGAGATQHHHQRGSSANNNEVWERRDGQMERYNNGASSDQPTAAVVEERRYVRVLMF